MHTPDVAHNAALPGDELTTIRLNKQWRQYVTALLSPLSFPGFYEGTEVERQAAADYGALLLDDIYTVDTAASMDTVGAKIVRITTQVIPSTTWTQIVFNDPSVNDDAFDTDGYWNVAQGGRLTVPAGLGGVYLCTHTFYLGLTSTFAPHWVEVRRNGVGVFSNYQYANYTWMSTMHNLVELDDGEYIETFVYTSGASSYYGSTTGTYASLSMIRVLTP